MYNNIQSMQKSLKYFREQRLDQQHKAAIRFESYYSGAIRNPSASLTAIIFNVGREDEFSGLILQHLSPVGHRLRGKARPACQERSCLAVPCCRSESQKMLEITMLSAPLFLLVSLGLPRLADSHAVSVQWLCRPADVRMRGCRIWRSTE